MKKHYSTLLFLVSLFLVPRLAEAQFEVWGTSYYGGVYFSGDIFKADATGNMSQTVYSFTGGADGKYPMSGLIRGTNGLIYGCTSQGGTNNLGVVFALDPGTGNLVNTFSFDGAGSGSSPRGELLEASNGKIYGMTSGGGANNLGTFFELDPAGFVFTKKIDFDGTGNGATPASSGLMEASNGKLYAVTGQGGINNAGVIFEYDMNTSTLTKKADFDVAVTGGSAGGRLIETSPGIFYGATQTGTALGEGCMFEFDLNTSTLVPKALFVDSVTGYDVRSGFMQASNDKLYGITYSGGPEWAGTLVEYDIALDSFTYVVDFGTLDTGTLITWEAWSIPLEASNGKLYCTSRYGGTGNGSIFTYDFVNNSYEILVDLLNSGSESPGGQQLLEMPLQAPDVWPGDCNYDLVANNYDFLNVGLAWNETGAVRPGASTSWTAQPSADWTQVFGNGLNMKHADTDGDGVVNGADSIAILQNYGSSHLFRLANPVTTSIGDFHLVPVSAAVAPGLPVVYNMVAGSATLPLDNLYGIAFRLSFDTSLISPVTPFFNFTSSLLGTLNTNLEVLTKNVYTDGYIDVALTRTDHTDALNVNGSLGTVTFMASSTVFNATVLEVTPIQVVMTTASGTYSNLYPLQDPVTIDPSLSSISSPVAEHNLFVYPNPATDQATVYWNSGESALIELFDITGKKMYSTTSDLNGTTINTSNFANGVYQVTITTGREVLKGKLIVGR